MTTQDPNSHNHIKRLKKTRLTTPETQDALFVFLKPNTKIKYQHKSEFTPSLEALKSCRAPINKEQPRFIL